MNSPSSDFSIPAEFVSYFSFAAAELIRTASTAHRDLWGEAMDASAVASDEQGMAAMKRLAVSERNLGALCVLFAETLAFVDGDKGGSIELTAAPAHLLRIVLEDMIRGVIPMAQMRLGTHLSNDARAREIKELREAENWAFEQIAALRARLEEWNVPATVPRTG